VIHQNSSVGVWRRVTTHAVYDVLLTKEFECQKCFALFPKAWPIFVDILGRFSWTSNCSADEGAAALDDFPCLPQHTLPSLPDSALSALFSLPVSPAASAQTQLLQADQPYQQCQRPLKTEEEQHCQQRQDRSLTGQQGYKKSEREDLGGSKHSPPPAEASPPPFSPSVSPFSLRQCTPPTQF